MVESATLFWRRRIADHLGAKFTFMLQVYEGQLGLYGTNSLYNG